MLEFFAASARLIARATSVEPVKTTPATRRVIDEPRADGAVAGHELQRARRDARLVQEAHGRRGDERRLLGRFRDDAVAGDQRRRDLAEEDRERKVPRRDRDEDAASAQAQHVRLARRPGHRLPGPEQAAALRRVIASEIDRLADLRERVVEGLAALDLQQVDEPPAPRLEEVRGALERRRPLRRRASRSRPESRAAPPPSLRRRLRTRPP